MYIGDYVEERLADVRYYLRGIHFNNLNSERLVEGLIEDASDFFNNEYRSETNKLIRDIRGMYDTLKDHKLEFATTKAEVDNEILKFERNLKQKIVEFKNRILYLIDKRIPIDNIPEDFNGELINTSMDEVNIRVRSRKEKRTMKEMHDMKELFWLRESFAIIYLFMTHIEDKKEKLNEINERIFVMYELESEEMKIALNAYNRLFKENDHDNFRYLYELVDKDLSVIPRRGRH